MKKHLIYLLTFLLLGFLPALTVYAQAPEKFYFQAEARDSKGKPIAKALDLSVKITILKGSTSGTVVWEGDHVVTTDDYGLFTLVIGEGTGGSYYFWAIDWANNTHYLNVQVYDKGTWVDMGTTQFLSVPYALHATKADSAINFGESDPIFHYRFNITSPLDKQLLRYNSAISKFENVDASVSEAWNLTGNAGTDPANNFLGTTDDNPIVFKVNNSERMRLNSNGNLAFSGTGGSVFIGNGAGMNDDFSDNRNVFIGFEAGNSNTTGYDNTATGWGALRVNNGNFNTANGSYTLHKNIDGGSNTATGYVALYSNISGTANTAHGVWALGYNTTGERNTATGLRALGSNITGSNNTAIGYYAMDNNYHGSNNTATGFLALHKNKTGNYNTAVGYWSGPLDYGMELINTGAFGNGANVTESNTIRIGNDDITQIGGAVGWSNLSDGRFKLNVTPDVPGLEFVMNLRPVIFNWDLEALDQFHGIDNEDIKKNTELVKAQSEKGKKVYTGLIAQEVEEAANAIGFDFSGIIKPANEKSSYNLAYAEFVVPLIKAIQEQQQMIEELQQEIDSLKK